MASASPLAVVVTADLSGLTKGVNDAAKIANSGGGAIAAAFANVKKATEGATGAMADFAKGQRQQDRMFGWYTGQLADMAGATKGTQAAMTGLAGAVADLATGSYIGAAVGAISLAVTAWHSFNEASTKATEEAKKKTQELTDLIIKQRQELEKVRFLQAGGTERGFEVSQSKKAHSPRLDELNEQIARYEKPIEGQSDYFNSIINERLGKLYEERSKILQNLRTAEMNAIALDNAESAKKLAEQEAEKQEAERKKLEEHLNKKLEAIRKYHEAEASFSLSAYQATKGVDLTRSQGGAWNLQGQQELQMQYGSSRLGQGAAGEAALSAMTARNQSPEQQDESKKLDVQLRKEQLALDATQKKWQSYGSAVVDTLAEISQGHKKWGDLWKQIMGMALKEAINFAIKHIAAQAGVTAANVEAENSKTGPWGWAIGLAQAAAAMAATLGFQSVISSEGGVRLGGGFSEQLAILHPYETVLPRGDSDTLARLEKQTLQPQRGPTVVNINANDVKSIHQLLKADPHGFELMVEEIAEKVR